MNIVFIFIVVTVLRYIYVFLCMTISLMYFIFYIDKLLQNYSFCIYEYTFTGDILCSLHNIVYIVYIYSAHA